MMRRNYFLGASLFLLIGCSARAPDALQPPSIVFFNGDSAALGPVAQGVIAHVAADARARSGPVRVRGFAAPPGSVAYNAALSEARARNVADNLVAAGVPANNIRVEARGEAPVAAALVESQRVEIVLGD